MCARERFDCFVNSQNQTKRQSVEKEKNLGRIVVNVIHLNSSFQTVIITHSFNALTLLFG